MDILLYQFNRGDERAFKKLFDSFFGASCAFVKHYIPEHEAVEDVVQETFINLWEKRGICTDMVYFKAYLYKSLRNNALFYLRQHKVSEEVDPGIEDDTESALNAIIEEEVHREIIAAIDKLPPERRRVVELSMVGYSQEEIAEKLNISVNTVKTQKRKAYAFLREELQHLFVLFLMLLNL
ncbi:MAG: RNA polymerase sigma factor [Butyricimonas paravirosa]